MNSMISTESLSGMIKVMPMQGRIDAATVNKNKEQMIENFIDHNGPIVLNLQDVSFVDSTGLGMLVTLHKMQVELGQPMVLCEMADQVRLLLELTRLNLVFDIYDNQSSALESLG